ncbi:FkbM family methyltransferase [Halovenus marina]|uniref:FkbM family methyltransferase n=1 Tax=Halovenus marina TaxID=3396621 RepID=UPI003F572796
MSELIQTVDRLSTKLGIRPIAAWLYWRWRGIQKRLRDLRYKQYRLRRDTYRVTVGNAEAEFSVLTRQEYFDFLELKERPILDDFLSNLRADDVFYDLGANVGLYSCLAADIVTSPVVAFEPHPKNADRLEQNATLNESDISVYRCALAASEGTAELRLAPGFDIERLGSAGHSLVDHEEEDTETITVETRPGDEFVESEQVPPPTVLKIDVEGAEMGVIEGLESTLSSPDCRLVYCEVHEERLQSQGHSVSDITDVLESHGFSVEERVVDGYQTFLRAEK